MGSEHIAVDFTTHKLFFFLINITKMSATKGQNFSRFDYPIEYKNFSEIVRFKDWNSLVETTKNSEEVMSTYQHKDKIIMEKLCSMDLQVASPQVLAQNPYKDGNIMKKLFGSKL